MRKQGDAWFCAVDNFLEDLYRCALPVNPSPTLVMLTFTVQGAAEQSHVFLAP